MFKWPSSGREFTRAAVVLAAFLFIIYFGLLALSHPGDVDARTFLRVLVFIAACGAAAFVSYIWKE